MKMLLFKIFIISAVLAFAMLGFIFSSDIARIIAKVVNPVYGLPLILAILIVLGSILIAIRRKKLSNE
jgi:hypothetical protein